jgi:two-component sensor histidine kinase
MQCYATIATAYDAWNQQPQKTVDYFEKTKAYALKVHDTESIVIAGIYMASASLKNKDTAQAIQLCHNLTTQYFKSLDSTLRQQLYVEAAYICACAKNYAASLEYSSKVQNPDGITNDFVNFKSHQIITNIYTHLYYTHTDMNSRIDSLKTVLSHTTNLSDSLHYYSILEIAYSYLQQHDSLAKYKAANKILNSRFFNAADNATAKNAYLEHTLGDEERKNSIAQAEKSVLQKNTQIMAIIVAALLIISVLIFINRKNIATKNKTLFQLNQQLDAKAIQNELLVKEMHQRVKNNLTLIYSLLEMQGKRTDSTETQEQLFAARQRIESIAITHEQLYNNKDGIINIHQYLTLLVSHILQGQSTAKTIVPQLHIEQHIELDSKRCLPVAMLINEWLTNTIKYAETKNHHIEILITARIQQNQLELTYGDNGITQNAHNPAGLGSKIISLLCKQLHAALDSQHNNKPFNYKIIFPYA